MFKKLFYITICILFLVSCSTPKEESVAVFDDQIEQNNITKSSNNSNDSNVDTQNKTNNLTTSHIKKLDITANVFNDDDKSIKQLFKKPMGITFDKDGNFYIVDQDLNKIVKFKNNGDLIEEWGEPGGGLAEFKEPKYIFTDSNNQIIVADTWNLRLQILNDKGEVVDIVTQEFFGPKGLWIHDNKYYIADTGHHVVKVLDKDGKLLQTLGAKDDKEFTLHEPTGLTVDDNGNIYIIDSRNNRIVKVDKDYKLVTKWKVKDWTDPTKGKESWLVYYKDKLYLSDPVNRKVRAFDTNGNELEPVAENLNGVSGLAVHDDKLYIVEFGAKKVRTVDIDEG